MLQFLMLQLCFSNGDSQQREVCKAINAHGDIKNLADNQQALGEKKRLRALIIRTTRPAQRLFKGVG
jgi:hypothetical protein